MSDRGQPTVESQIRELKVSGHTMALEPGVYCVFNAPGGPSAEDGLPGVRISPGPREEMGGQVSIASFQPDGWIGVDSAALVRVHGAAAEVLVTVYQSSNAKSEPPKLQVVRLNGEPAGAATAPAKPAATARPAAKPAAAPKARAVEVVAHIYGQGDVGADLGAWMGEAGSKRWIEGFAVAPMQGIAPADIEYQAVLGRGWLSPWSEGGQFCGSRGMSLPILGLRVRLKGKAAETHRVGVSATFVDGTEIGPVGDGEACEAPSLAALEAFQVTLEPMRAKAAAKTAPAKTASVKRAAAPAPAPAKRAAKAAPVMAKPAAKSAPKPLAKAPLKAAAKPAPKPGPKAIPKPGAKPAVKPMSKPAPRAAAKRTPATTRRR